MPTNKNQHFVPQFYLRRFSRDKKSISLFRIEDKSVIELASIKGQCSKSKYYAQGNGIDDLFKALENGASTILQRFSENGKVEFLNNSECERFYLFLATQMFRTPVSQSNGLQVEEDLIKIVREGAPEGAKLPLELEGLPIDHIGYSRIAIRLYPQLLDLKACILVNNSKLDFVTSDCPVVIFNRAGEQNRVSHSIGFSNAGIIVYYPIDPRCGLLLFDAGMYRTKEFRHGSILANSKDVEGLNRLQVLNANEIILFKNSAKVNFPRVYSDLSDKQAKRMKLREFVYSRKTSRGTVYVKPKTGDHRAVGQSSLVAMSQIPIKAGFALSFLHNKIRPSFVDTGSSAGCQRNPEFSRIARQYTAAVGDGKAVPLKFFDYLASEG